MPPGTVIPITLCGHQIALFRPESGGPPAALDAYCTHLGANISVNGKVVGDCVECPFHAWRFAADGTVKWTPTFAEGGKLPQAASTMKSYPCMERNGLICVWMSSLQHAQGAAPPSGVSCKPSVSTVASARDAALGSAKPAPSQCPTAGMEHLHALGGDGHLLPKPAGTAEAAASAGTWPLDDIGSIKCASGVAPAKDAAGTVIGVADATAAFFAADQRIRDERKPSSGEAVEAVDPLATDAAWSRFNYPPLWLFPRTQVDQADTVVFHGFTEHCPRAHINELPENGADVAHLSVLHEKFVIPWLDWLLCHTWDGCWRGTPSSPLVLAKWDAAARRMELPRPRQAAEARRGKSAPSGPSAPTLREAPASMFTDKVPAAMDGIAPTVVLKRPDRIPSYGPHLAHLSINQKMKFRLGGDLPGSGVPVSIIQCGPAVVLFKMLTPLGTVFFSETVHPVQTTQMVVRHGFWATPGVPRFVVKAVAMSVATQYEQDLEVWSNKRYVPLPVLSQADKHIRDYRNWMRQFVRTGAITFEEACKREQTRALDW